MKAHAFFALALALTTWSTPALALDTNTENPDDIPFTPRPAPTGPMPFDVAQRKIRAYLETVPNLPKDVVVVPATGIMPWPNSPADKTVNAEVWTVVSRSRNDMRPIMMFAVHVGTGDVYALFMRSLQQQPLYKPAVSTK